MERWDANMYALVPTMHGANYAILSRALDAMKIFYADERRRLATKLVVFDVFLRRSDMVSEEDRSRIMQKMRPFVDLMAESPYMQKARAEGIAKGDAEGEKRGRTEMLQDNILKIVKMRFPYLTKMARQKIWQVTELDKLDELFNALFLAADAQAVRLIFEELES